MKRLHQPLTLRNDISIQNKFNFKSNWFLIYEGESFLLTELLFIVSITEAFTRKSSCFMPRAANTWLWEGFWYPAVIFWFQWVYMEEAKGKEMLGSLTVTQKELPTEGSDSWARRGQSLEVIISLRFYTRIPAKLIRVPKDSRFLGGKVGLRGNRNEPEHRNKHP